MAAARLVVISNRKSSRNSGSLGRVQQVLDDYPGEVLHRIIDNIAEISAVLDAFATFEPDILIINGGDGTIQAVLTESSRHKPFGELPPILVLPGGKTNLVAEDLGAFSLPEEILKALVPALEDGSWRRYLTERPLIKLRMSPGADPVYGAFFGTAAVVRGLEFVRRHIHPLHLPNVLTHVAAIGFFLIVGLFYRNGRKSPLRADNAALAIDEATIPSSRYFMIMATTLNRLLLGMRPFPAGQSEVALKVTTVNYSFGSIARGFMATLFRSIDRAVPRGMVATEAKSLRLQLDCPVTLDGEFFWPQADEPVELSVTRAVTFLKVDGLKVNGAKANGIRGNGR
jgi:hypothetical protein